MSAVADSSLAALCAAIYAGDPAGLWDMQYHTWGVDWAHKALPDFSLFGFEGTHDPRDGYRDVLFKMVQGAGGIGGVEYGFYQGMEDVIPLMMNMAPMSKPIILIGHSLGAARAHIAANILIRMGYPASSITRVVWGSPKPGDAIFAARLKNSPCRSYRNYRDVLDQDMVCLLPEPLPGMGFQHPGDYVIINEAPDILDPWLILARHHFELYQKGTP